MGASNSAVVSMEQPNWECDHKLQINAALRTAQRPLLENLKNKLMVCTSLRKLHALEYTHHFISDGSWVLEFGDGTLTETSLRIFATAPDKSLAIQKEFELTTEVKRRMMSIIGATNYSMCLRNSEHMANYIQSGTWYSLQMTGDNTLLKTFKHQLEGRITLVNTLPEDLQPKNDPVNVLTPIYADWVNPFKVTFQKKKATLTPAADAVNVVVLGPTGAGKSSIINAIFNQRVSKVKASTLSVTRHMDVYSGFFYQHIPGESGNNYYFLNVIDSVGFCDSVIPPLEVSQIVKDFIKANLMYLHRVIFVCAGRIEAGQAQAMKNLMVWLGYSKHKTEFVFIYNKTENLEDDEKLECLGQMCDLIGADAGHTVEVNIPGTNNKQQVPYTLATGFPPRAPLRDVKDDLEALHKAIFFIRIDRNPIRVDESSCSIL